MNVESVLVVFVKLTFGKVEVPRFDENARRPEEVARINNMRNRIKDKNCNKRRKKKS